MARVREKVVLMYIGEDEDTYVVPCNSIEVAADYMFSVKNDVDWDSTPLQLFKRSNNDELVEAYEAKEE